MYNDTQLKELGLNIQLKPALAGKGDITEKEHYKLAISPPMPEIPEFKPNQYFYQSFTSGTVSIIGRYHQGSAFYQLAIVAPRNIANGKYEFAPWGEGVVSADYFVNGIVYTGAKGKLVIERNEENRSVAATFEFDIVGTPNQVKHGSLFLLATGDL